MTTLPAKPLSKTTIIDRYCEVWSEPETERRRELLSSIWTNNASYTDPTVQAFGAEALLAHIEGVRQQYPGAAIKRTSNVDEHHQFARFAWQLTKADGDALPEGLDIVTFNAGGTMIEQVVGFFGPLKRTRPSPR